MKFNPGDWTILAAYFVGTLYLGLRGNKRVKSVTDFLVAGREVNVYVGAATLLATETAVITILNFGEVGFVSGLAGFVLAVITGGVMIWIGKTGFIIEKLRQLELVTIPEYFERRYDRGTRIICGILLGVGAALNMGIFLKYDALFLSIMIGVPSFDLAILMVILLVVVLVYVFLGGMVSVVLTDYVQFVFLSIGFLIATVMIVFRSNLSHILSAVGSIPGGGLNPFTSPTMGWTFIVWQVVFMVALWTTWQTTVMRVFSAKDAEVGKKTFIWTGVMMVGMYVITIGWGVAARAQFGSSIVPVQGLPRLLSLILPGGLRGLIVAAMMAASMSTYSAYLLGWSAIFAEDIIIPFRRKTITPEKRLRLNRVIVILMGIFLFVYGLLYKASSTIYVYTSMTANLYLAGTFIGIVGGLYWKKANTVGAYASLILGTLPIIAFFFLHLSAGVAGVASFIMAIAGMFFGSHFNLGRKVETVL